MKRILLFLMVLLSLPAAAAPSVDALVHRLDRYLPDDLQGAIVAVRLDPAAAEALVRQVAAGGPGGERPGYNASLAARVLGRSDLEDLLRSKGLLEPEGTWAGGPLGDLPAGAPLEIFERAAAVAARGGLYREASWFLAFVSRVEGTDRLRDFELALMTAGGLFDPERGLLEERLRSVSDPRVELLDRLTALEVGRRGLRPARVRAQLEPAAALARRLGEGRADFAVEAFALEDALARGAVVADFEARHDRAWAALRPGASESLMDALLWRQAAEGARVWLAELARRGDLARLEADLRTLRELGVAQMVFAHDEALLDLAASARLRGDLERARELLARAGTTEALARLEASFQEAIQGLGDELDFRRGEAGRLEARRHEQALRLVMAGGLPPDQLFDHVIGVMERGFAGRSDLTGVSLGLALAELLAWLPADDADLRPALEGVVARQRDELVERSRFFHDRPRLVEALYWRARSGEGVEDLLEAVTLLEAYVAEVGGPAEVSRSLRQRSRAVYELLAERLLQAGRQAEAMDMLARLRQVETHTALREAVRSAAPAGLVAEADRLAAETRQLEARLQDPLQPQAEAERVGRLLAETRADYYSAVKALQDEDPDFLKLAVRPLNFSRVQAAMPADAVVVQYFPAADRLYVFTVTREALKVREVAVTRAALEETALTALRSLSRAADQVAARGWDDPRVASLKGSLTELHRVLVDPVEEEIRDKKVVAFIPSGVLTYLPFAALARPRAEGGLEFLVERKETVTLLKSADLDGLAAPPAAGGGAFVAVGNPDGTLESASREVAALAGVLPRATVAVEGEATRARFLELVERPPAYLHLATHGSFDPRDPEASFLVLADGQLSVADITGLRLDGTRLVALSACQTGLGRTEDAYGQDLTTLAEAFWFGGGRSLLASMWSVSDDSTRDLMVAFYRGLAAGRTRAQALREAQLSLLRDPSLSAPYYWAPFVLTGDWR